MHTDKDDMEGMDSNIQEVKEGMDMGEGLLWLGLGARPAFGSDPFSSWQLWNVGLQSSFSNIMHSESCCPLPDS